MTQSVSQLGALGYTASSIVFLILFATVLLSRIANLQGLSLLGACLATSEHITPNVAKVVTNSIPVMSEYATPETVGSPKQP